MRERGAGGVGGGVLIFKGGHVSVRHRGGGGMTAWALATVATVEKKVDFPFPNFKTTRALGI